MNYTSQKTKLSDDSTPDNGILSGFMNENLFQENNEIHGNDLRSYHLMKVITNPQEQDHLKSNASSKKLNFYEEILFQNAVEIYQKSIKYLPAISFHENIPSSCDPLFCGISCHVKDSIGETMEMK
jgi:hypothetical protein